MYWYLQYTASASKGAQDLLFMDDFPLGMNCVKLLFIISYLFIQVARLEECERLLLAIQVSGWLNDTALCLQAVVQCYGLLAPLIHQKIPAKPVVQVCGTLFLS